MSVKAIIFDLYGTLIDVETDEEMEEIYRTISHFLTYWGVDMHRWEVKTLYFEIMKRRRAQSTEKHSEIDVEGIWADFLTDKKARYLERDGELKTFAKQLAILFRAISRKRLQPYENVHQTLDALRVSYPLAMVSDAQPCFALEEIRAVGLHGYFNPIIISGTYGYRKPDSRLFQKALGELGVAPHEAIFVGNDMFRDIHGASTFGMKTIFFASNQGTPTYPATSPDYYVNQFKDIISGVEFLARQ